MARVQAGYNPGAEALQTTAAPNIQTIRAREADPNASKAFQLASALGSPTVQQGLDPLKQRVDLQEEQKAMADARNLPNSELEKQIKDGNLLPVQSPVRVAAMRHVYGENLYNRVEMDVTTKAANGTFGSWEDAEKYMQEQRASLLQNQDQYTSAGFDKRWGQLVNKTQQLQLRTMNANATEFANTQGNAKLNGVLTQIDSGEQKDGAQALGDAYRDSVNKKLFNSPSERSNALNSVLTSVTAKGNGDLLEGFLKQKLDNGATVADVVGPDKVAQYRHQISLVKNREEKAAAQAQVANLAEQSQSAARSNVELAVAAGNYAFLPGQKVINPSTGAYEDLGDKQKKMAEEAINRQIQANNLPLDKQMQVWSTNGLQNPEWEKQIQAGVSNVASVGWAFDGKNVGQLNQQGQAAISKYIELANVNPGEADKYAGSKENQRLLSDIKFMVEKGGMPNVNDAAAFVNQSNRRGIEGQDAAIKHDQVVTAVNEVVNPHFYSSAVNWVSTLFGGNEDVNLTAIGSDIRRRAELLVQSGQVPDAKAAVKASVEYFSNPAITTKINNTLYFNKDLPSVPQGESQGEWMERFIKEKVAPTLVVDEKTKGQGEKLFNSANPLDIAASAFVAGEKAAPVSDKSVSKEILNRVRLEPNTTGGYTAWVGGVPMTDDKGTVMQYSKSDVQKWITDTYQDDIRQKTSARNNDMTYENWSEKVKRDYYDSKKGQVVPGQSGAAPLGYITSRGAYDRLKEAKMLDKPVPELVEFFKSKKGK